MTVNCARQEYSGSKTSYPYGNIRRLDLWYYVVQQNPVSQLVYWLIEDPLPEWAWMNTGEIRLLLSTGSQRLTRHACTNCSQSCSPDRHLTSPSEGRDCIPMQSLATISKAGKWRFLTMHHCSIAELSKADYFLNRTTS